MATLFASSRSALTFTGARLIARTSPTAFRRAVSTLPNNQHIYVHSEGNSKYLLSLLPNAPPLQSLALGTSTRSPPTPDTFTENHDFMTLVHLIIAENAAKDPDVIAQAGMYASQAGSSLGSGGSFFPQQRHQRKRKGEAGSKAFVGGGGGGTSGDGAGGASSQGGMGGAGRGGYIHVSDQRQPPDFGRVAWPEDIFGSLELDGSGNFVDGNGRYQPAGTYRMITNEGVFGLSEFLRGKLVERLKELDAQMRR